MTEEAKNDHTQHNAEEIPSSDASESLEVDRSHRAEDDIPEEQTLEEKLAHYVALSEQLKKEAEENHHQCLLARADLENYRRRSRKEMESTLKYASLSLVEVLLPVLDNFERALEAVDKDHDTNTVSEGIEMVYRQLQSALKNAGLSQIEAKGQVFDPHQHNAVMQEESDDVESGIVMEELQAGYRFLDRVVRPAMVKISK